MLPQKTLNEMHFLTILAAYIFSYFVGQSDGLHLAWSRDGYNWTPIAENAPLLKPEVGEDKLMRDPSICQGPDGTFHMVWTSSWTDRIIGYASSPDLIHWSSQKAIPVMMHEPAAHNCWAPEVFYNDEDGLFYILWATTIPGRHSEVKTSESEKGLNHRIYFTTTRDFESFSPTMMYFDPGFSVIDAAIAENPASGEYVMVVKNENSAPAEKNLRVCFSSSLKEGFPTEVSAPIHGDFWAEGPSPLFLEDGSLIVYFDKYRDHEYGAVRSTDGGRTWSEVPDGMLNLPEGIRHGTAFRVSDEVIDNLLEHYSLAAPKPLFRDPVYDGAADPSIVRRRDTGEWYMFYTDRRANIGDTGGVEWVHGTPIGIAVSADLAHWDYLGQANIGYAPDKEPTYWAPSVIDDGNLYHMYLTYVPGIFPDWNHPRNIVHLTSANLTDWKYESTLRLMSDKVIDAEVEKLPDGTWRMWYNQEPGGKKIASADSRDLYNWEDNGLVAGIGNCEGPSVFRWKGSWWMVTDEWKGFAVYRSDDAVNWTRQPGNILQEPGHGTDDGVAGNHCDVLVTGDRAFIFYFVHPERDGRTSNPDGSPVNTRRSLIQVAELVCDGKTISCDRDALTVTVMPATQVRN